MRKPIESAHDLAGQIDLERRVDRDDVVVLADPRGVVGVIAGMELDERVVVDEVVEAPVPMTKLVTIRPGCTCLCRFVIDARLDQIDDAVREHLGVDAEVVLVEQAPQHRVRNRADAHLQRRAVVHQPRHVLADRVLDGVDGRRRMHVCSGRSVWMKAASAIERDERVAVRARHLLVDFGDDMRAVCAAASAASTEVPSVQ